MTDPNLQSRIVSSVEGQDDFWNQHRIEITAGAESWFRQNGIVNGVVINNVIVTLLCAVRGIKDISFSVDAERGRIKFFFALNWLSYYFRRKSTLDIWGPALCAHFPTYDVELTLYRHSPDWENKIRKDFYEIEEKEQKEREKSLKIIKAALAEKGVELKYA